MAFFGKKYKMDKTENLDTLLQEAGLPDEQVKGLISAKPLVWYEKQGDNKISMTYSVGEKTVKTDIELGKETEEMKGDKKIINVYTLSGDVLTQDIKLPSGKTAKVVRKLFADKMELTATLDGSSTVGKAWFAVA